MKRFWTLGLSLLLLAGCNSGGSSEGAGSQGSGEYKPTVAYVTNGIASFWVIAEKGAKAAGEEFNVDVEVLMPPGGDPGEQKRMVQDLLTRGVDGVAISPINPDNQGDLLQEIADETNLITQDSDAPNSPRLCYVGMDNYTAGRMCGELVKEALPDGGSLMIFVGRLGQLNAKQRRQGLIDELLDRQPDPNRYDEPGEVPQDGKYKVVDTRTDQFDFAQAKAQAEDALTGYPDLDCMVGLFAYNPPACLEAVRQADKVGQVKIVAFDEDDQTLQGIKDGDVYGTVVQNPYQYGFESVRILAGLARDDKSVLPEDKFVDIPARKITKDEVDEFWTELKKLTGE